MGIEIDLAFDFMSDTPQGKDPDSHSPTLRMYHKIIWNKPLPNGELFELVDTKSNSYLYHNSSLGEFFLSSDAITHSYRNRKKMANIINNISPEIHNSLFNAGSTIGSYILFPSNRINMQMTINGARGCNNKIDDRFDLTLECIRLFYLNIDNPLMDALKRYSDFFNLFGDFKGYVDFFLLQDLVTSDYKNIRFHLARSGFTQQPLPQNIDEYLEYRQNTLNFINARGKRIKESLS